MKLVIRSDYLSISPDQAEDQVLSLSLIPSHRLGILPLVVSTAFHAFASVVFMVVSPYLFSIDPDTVNLARFHVEPLRLSLNQPLYLPVPMPAAAAAAASTAGRRF